MFRIRQATKVQFFLTEKSMILSAFKQDSKIFEKQAAQKLQGCMAGLVYDSLP